MHTVCEGAKADEVRDILGHANIDVTQNVYGKNCWEEREMRSVKLSKQ
jgi:integrase